MAKFKVEKRTKGMKAAAAAEADDELPAANGDAMDEDDKPAFDDDADKALIEGECKLWRASIILLGALLMPGCRE